MKRLLLILIPICGLLSCSNEMEEEQSLVLMTKSSASVSSNNGETAIERDINNFITQMKFGGISAYSNDSQNYSLTPFVYEGDTVMYIANYASGWDLFSTDRRTPLIMASSDTGSFDPDDSSMAPAFRSYLYSVAEELHNVKQSGTDGETYGLWNTVSIQNDEVDLQEIEVSPYATGTQPGNGYWVLISTSSPVTTTYTSNKLTSTRWYQSSPWNAFVPFAPGSTTQHCVAGCSAVATAQYLYYLHYKNNKPASTVTTATYQSASNEYIYTGSSSTVWNQMAKTADVSGTDYAAIFIGHVGKSISTTYGASASGSDITKSKDFINSMGYNYQVSSMDYTYISRELVAGRAVLARAFDSNSDPNNPEGHQFIIDRYRATTTTTTSTFGWVGTDNLGQDSNEYDENGNIVGYSFFYTSDNATTSYAYSMNWGWKSTTWENVYFNASDNSSWNVDKYVFNTNRRFLK